MRYNSLVLLPWLIGGIEAQNGQTLVGTWTTKSNAVFTGPNFYDPVNEVLHEPKLTGQSISFTSDFYFEQAIYVAIANPQNPACPKAIMQFQHGTYSTPANGSILLNPIAVDGRQLWSDPCSSKTGVYTRYNQTELYKSYQLDIDEYNSKYRLRLFKFDGAPVPPMFLAYNPPQMLPTVTLNPTAMAAGATSSPKAKRELDPGLPPLRKRVYEVVDQLDLERWWYIGVIMTILGAIGFFAV